MSHPIREPKVGIISIERPFRIGYLNPRLNKVVDDDTYAEYIGFLDPTDHWSAVDDEIEEFPDGRGSNKHRKAAKTSIRRRL